MNSDLLICHKKYENPSKTIHACGLWGLTPKGGSILLRLKASYYFYTSQGAANTKIDLASK